MFVVPWGDFTYVGTTDTDYDGPIDDPQCTPDDVEYCALNVVPSEPVTRPTSSRRGRGCVRCCGRPRASAPPTSPAATGASTDWGRHDHRRQAHDVSPDGGRHDRRGQPAARPAVPVPHEAPDARGRRRLRGPTGDERAEPARAPRRPFRHRATVGLDRVDADRPRPARSRAPDTTCGPRRCTPYDTRWRARSTTCCHAPSTRHDSGASRRVGRRRRIRRRTARPRARLGRSEARARPTPFRTALAHEREAFRHAEHPYRMISALTHPVSAEDPACVNASRAARRGNRRHRSPWRATPTPRPRTSTHRSSKVDGTGPRSASGGRAPGWPASRRRLAEDGRDWWPLAMIWALGKPRRRAGIGAMSYARRRPTRSRRSPADLPTRRACR